jgi:DNA-binding NarL/FixJ family response regulator
MNGESKKREVQILLADDQPIIRYAVRKLLAVNPRFRVVGEAIDGEEAVVQAEAIRPHVIILNISMPKKSGLEAAREIRAIVPEVAVIILSTHADEQLIEEARRCGAMAYVNKSEAGTKLILAVEAASQGTEAFIN